ncbi:uncharacterized protein LOC117171104 [Belonocnema kinseyi]|uniref:uncharacterized protein LOC117171104 n=1 Tax=Belonocnema kinseyi TaxID=2817044 RepID=UPI00143CD3B5|nr:uncharacterized protein LOC117171104 [Belonocnema kinseyi]
MKILVGTFVTLINFGALSASGTSESGPSRAHFHPPSRNSSSIRNIFYQSHIFEVFERPAGVVRSVSLHKDLNIIPTLYERMKNKIKVRLAHADGIHFYVFEEPNKKIMAAELPLSGPLIPTDIDFTGLTKVRSFFYLGRSIGVYHDHQGKLREVGLLNPTNVIPIVRERQEYNIRIYRATDKGVTEISFLVYELPNGFIIGVEFLSESIPQLRKAPEDEE